MKYSLLINSNKPNQGAGTALQLAEHLLSSEHSIYRLFFYQSGVLLASNSPSPKLPNQAILATSAWQDMIIQHDLDAVVCISAALRRHLISEQESRSSVPHYQRLAAGFQLSGLGQLADAMANSDRFLSFG